VHPGIVEGIGFALGPDVEAVAGMEKDGNPDADGLNDGAEGEGLELLADGVVFFGADEDVAVGPEMLGEKDANGNDARKRMEFSPEETGLVVGLCGRHRQRLIVRPWLLDLKAGTSCRQPEQKYRPQQNISIAPQVPACNEGKIREEARRAM